MCILVSPLKVPADCVMVLLRVVQASAVPTSRLVGTQDHHLHVPLVSPAGGDRLHFVAVGDSAGVIHLFRAADLSKVMIAVVCCVCVPSVSTHWLMSWIAWDGQVKSLPCHDFPVTGMGLAHHSLLTHSGRKTHTQSCNHPLSRDCSLSHTQRTPVSPATL